MWTLDRLRPVLRAAWGPDTCDPADLGNWRPDNPAKGQCGVTALVLQDLLGGDLILGEVWVDGTHVGWHYWNRLPDGTEVDLTREQFEPHEVIGASKTVQRPGRLPRRCRGQYELLRRRVVGSSDGDQAPLIRIALALVRDPDGAVLLNLRDEDAQAEPGQWSLPGGHVEQDEEPEQAARRELAEETGLTLDAGLTPYWSGGSSPVEVRVFAGRCDAVQSQSLRLGEGQRLAFVPVKDLITVDLSPTAAAILRGLVTGAPMH